MNHRNVNVSVLDKERQCIELTSNIMLQHHPAKSLSWHLYDSVVEPFKDPLTWILLPLFLLLAPYSIYEAFRAYKKQEAERKDLASRAILHDTPHQNLSVLWDRYGLPVERFYSDDQILAECLSNWITILYNGTYDLTPSQILQLFSEESSRQSSVLNEGYARGLMLNLLNWRIVVFRNIVNNAPSYG